MNHKKYFLAIACAFAFSQNVLTNHVVVVDGEKVALNSKIGKSIKAKLEKEQKKLSAPLEKQQAAIQEMDKEYAEAKKAFEKEAKKLQGKEGELLSPEAREKEADKLQAKAQEIQEMEVKIQHKIKQFQDNAKRIEQKFAAVYEKEMAQFDKKIKHAIEVAAKKENWDVAIMKGATAYCNPSADQTQVVIDVLDKEAAPGKA